MRVNTLVNVLTEQNASARFYSEHPCEAYYMVKQLSEKQLRILEFIQGFLEEHQYPPTVRDIQGGCEISSTSVVDYNLRILQREGHLKRQNEVSRGIELLGSNRRATSNMVTIPIVSSIAAGEPLPVPTQDSWNNENTETMDLPSFLTEGRENVFGVRVKGQSMIDALVTDGDLVLLEPDIRERSASGDTELFTNMSNLIGLNRIKSD